jgi:TRAP-type C4-dicarboxylate transport system permease small subunit
LKEFIYKLQLCICIPLMVLMCIVTFLQVVSRYVFNHSLYWSEELARYLFIWLTFVGAGIAVHRQSEMGIEFFTDLMSRGRRLAVEIGTTLLVMAFLAIAIVEGAVLALESWETPSVALGLPWTFIYLAVPIGFMLILLQKADQLKTMIRELRTENAGSHPMRRECGS